MAWRNMVRAALLVLAVSGAAACGERSGSPGDGSDATGDGAGVFLPQLKPPPRTVVETAELDGELTGKGGCLEVVDHTLVWPSDYRARREDGRVEVLDGSGRVVARVGDRVSGGGGETHSLGGWRLDRRTRRWLEERCGEPYWIVADLSPLGAASTSGPTPAALTR
ncbi:MAG: hypothetical protein H0V86_09105 [Chloroflexia bacterium]|nr:hypothetical protein [Chloroflexia bacterium]